MSTRAKKKKLKKQEFTPISIDSCDRRSITEIRNINFEIIKWNSQSEKKRQMRPDQKRMGKKKKYGVGIGK